MYRRLLKYFLVFGVLIAYPVVAFADEEFLLGEWKMDLGLSHEISDDGSAAIPEDITGGTFVVQFADDEIVSIFAPKGGKPEVKIDELDRYVLSGEKIIAFVKRRPEEPHLSVERLSANSMVLSAMGFRLGFVRGWGVDEDEYRQLIAARQVQDNMRRRPASTPAVPDTNLGREPMTAQQEQKCREIWNAAEKMMAQDGVPRDQAMSWVADWGCK